MDSDTLEMIRDFDVYLAKIQEVGRGARTNYMSWIRFLAKNHDLSEIDSEEDVKRILEREAAFQTMPSRTKYKKVKDLGNFRSTLNRFLPFIKTWRVEQDFKRNYVSIPALIDNIRMQTTPEYAKYLHDAIILVADSTNHLFTEEEQRKMRDNMKYVAATHVNNNFYKGSNPTLYQS